MPARWWSVTLYQTSDSMLPMNEDKALSIDATKIVRASEEGEMNWDAIIAPLRPGTASNWISSNGAQEFDLLLRLYEPDEALLMKPEETLPPPSIERIECKGDAA